MVHWWSCQMKYLGKTHGFYVIYFLALLSALFLYLSKYEQGSSSSWKLLQSKQDYCDRSLSAVYLLVITIFFWDVLWMEAKTNYRLAHKRAGRTLYCRKQALRSCTGFVIPHKCTLLLVGGWLMTKWFPPPPHPWVDHCCCRWPLCLAKECF